MQLSRPRAFLFSSNLQRLPSSRLIIFIPPSFSDMCKSASLFSGDGSSIYAAMKRSFSFLCDFSIKGLYTSSESTRNTGFKTLCASMPYISRHILTPSASLNAIALNFLIYFAISTLCSGDAKSISCPKDVA